MRPLPFDIDLAKRFVSDYKLPIPILDEDTFFYHIDLYEKDYQAYTKYCKVIDMIDERFGGDIRAFLDYYYEVREEIINTVTNSEAYKRFNNMPMEPYAIKEKLNIGHNTVFNEDNVGHSFISIDLKKANFQTLNLIDKEIIFN